MTVVVIQINEIIRNCNNQAFTLCTHICAEDIQLEFKINVHARYMHIKVKSSQSLFLKLVVAISMISYFKSLPKISERNTKVSE